MAHAATGSGYGELALTSLLVLAIICGLAWGVVRVMARWMDGRRVGGVVSIVSRVPLEPRRALYVVEAGGRTLLLGSSEMGVSLITELDVTSVPCVGADGARTGRFSALGGAIERVFAGRRAPSGERS